MTPTPVPRSLDELPAVLDVDVVAAFFDVSTWTVREMIRRGELRSVRMGRLIRVPRQAVAEFLDAGA